MKRDFICVCRLIIDSLPVELRNSRWLFDCLRSLLGLPEYFFYFRSEYQARPFDLAVLYKPSSPLYSKRLSPDSDLNSFHLRRILRIAEDLHPATILDLGCGSGFLLNQLRARLPNATLLFGVDYDLDSGENGFKYIQDDLTRFVLQQSAQSYDLVICTHTLEHLSNSIQVCQEIFRIARLGVILVCPLEKKFRWGLNYHVNFFSSKVDFADQLGLNHGRTVFEQRLGDLLAYIALDNTIL